MALAGICMEYQGRLGWDCKIQSRLIFLLVRVSRGSDQIRSYYISSSHTRLIRCLTLTGLSQARTDESGNTNFVILPHKSLHCSWALK